MKIATFNVNGVNGRLALLRRWLAESKPDAAWLQELKAPQEKFPIAVIRQAGYGAIWHGQKSWNGVAILARSGSGREFVEACPAIRTRHTVVTSRHRSMASWSGALSSQTLIRRPALSSTTSSAGSSATKHAEALLATAAPVVLAGDYNAMPTDLDVYKPERWVDDALFRPEVRDAFARLVARGGTDAVRELHLGERIYPFGITSETLGRAMRVCASIICSSVPRSPCASSTRASIAPSAAGKSRAITRVHLGGNRERVILWHDWAVNLWPLATGMKSSNS